MQEELISLNPATGKEIKRYPIDADSVVKFKLANAQKGFNHWRHISVRQRAAYLKSLSDYLQKHKKEMAEIATAEMGKPYVQSVSELEKCANTLAYYAENAAQMLQPETVEMGKHKSYVTYQPLGTVLAIMPWNFPYWQVYRAMGPILISGNSMLLKHASNVTGCALAIEKSLVEAGLPENLFQTLVLPSSKVEQVISHPAVQAVTFTGSTSAGAKVAATAAAHLKKQVLELGGSDAYVVLADADLKKAVEICAHSRLNNTGQSCIAAKRFIVDSKIISTFESQIKAVFESKKYGNPMDGSNQLGAMARIDLRDELHKQVEESIRKGAKLLCGGFIPDMPGAFYPPTLLTNVKKGMPAYEEEMFGPVGVIIEAKDEKEAIRIANDSEYGLGGAVFSKDIKRAEQIAAEQIEAGSVFVNDYVSSNARMPFGGIKHSGYGRELSDYGLREFVNIKAIAISE